MAAEMATPPSGRYPLVTPLAKQIRSGVTSQCSEANHVPVRPKPTMISSRTKTMPKRSHSARTPAR